MSPNTQVALIALILFLAIATVSLFWARLADPQWSRMKLASGALPHLQTDRWSGLMPTLRRLAGGALGLGTLVLLALWLLGGDRAQDVFGSPLGVAILFVYTLALMQYLAVGVRRLIWDFGYGIEPEMHRNIARATPMAAVLLTSLIWVGVQLRYGTPPSLPDRSARAAVKPQTGTSDPMLAYEQARRDYAAAQGELETLISSTRTVADGLGADPLRVDLSLWPSRDQLTEAQQQVRAAQGALRGAWASVPADKRLGLEPPPSE
jgi:succinate dehydrogenase / fumarate reductase, cytochrome b subunit